MTDEMMKTLYDKFCYDKTNHSYSEWSDLLKKFPDETVKKVFKENKIDFIGQLERLLVKTLPEQKQYEYYGYKNKEDMIKQLREKFGKLSKKND